MSIKKATYYLKKRLEEQLDMMKEAKSDVRILERGKYNRFLQAMDYVELAIEKLEDEE